MHLLSLEQDFYLHARNLSSSSIFATLHKAQAQAQAPKM